MKRTTFLAFALFFASAIASIAAPNLLPNPGFEEGLQGWTAWGPEKRNIATYKTAPAEGFLCLRIPAGDSAVYTYVAVKGGKAYRLTGKYRLGENSAGAALDLNYVKEGGGNGSAGALHLSLLPGQHADKNGWMYFTTVATPTRECTMAQFILRSGGQDACWYDDLKLEEVPLPAEFDPNAGAWDGITRSRTVNPLFKELLDTDDGNYYVSSWPSQFYTNGLSEKQMVLMTPDHWKQEMDITFQQMGESHMGALALPWAAQGSESPRDYWRSEATIKDLNARYKLQFDCAVESSAVAAAAVKGGAVVLNPAEVAKGGRPDISPIDPKYVDACVAEIERWGRMFGDESYCRAFEGMDEPQVPTLPGRRAQAVAFWAQCDQEVRDKYGFGKYGMPAPADPEWWARPQDHPFAWIAFNRWMADKYSDAAKVKFDAVKHASPTLLYTPCDFWFMSGFIPFDMNRMAKYADYLQCDPYASSAERRRGRGVYNHGFGAKLLRDLGGKHVQVVVQAFDYTGYKMTSDDLLEWCSQALRAGADRLCFYASDNPRFNDPQRWQTMVHVSKTVSEMKALKRPTATKTAILYSSVSHRAEGATTLGDEVYTAYALLGEKLGCWFDIISDLQIERGSRKLADYKVIYLPLGTYQDAPTAQRLAEWVSAGGVLICGDPTVWSFAPDGTDISALRSDLFGVNLGRATQTTSITLQDLPTPIYPRHTLTGTRVSTACLLVEPRAGVSVIGKYPDGTAAATSAMVGAGRAILFGANPFVPDAVLDSGGMLDFMAATAKAAGEPTGLDIWRFKLPAR